jgi:hypothetical protein
MAVAEIGSISYFLPIFSFLLIFIVVYAVLKKTGVLGDNNGVSLFISLILASFFIVNAKMVEFVEFNSSWFVVFLLCIVFIMLILGFLGKDSLKLVAENKGVAWGIVVALIVAFIVSGARIFRWVIEWDKIQRWFSTDWFGLILLLVIGAVVAWVLTKK